MLFDGAVFYPNTPLLQASTSHAKNLGDLSSYNSGLFTSYNYLIVVKYSDNLLFELFHDALV